MSLSMLRKYIGNADVQNHSFLTPALNEGEWSASRSGFFTTGEKPVPVYRKLVGPQSRSRRCGEKEILPLTRIFCFILTHCSTWSLTCNELICLPHLDLIIHHIRWHASSMQLEIRWRASCNWRFDGELHATGDPVASFMQLEIRWRASCNWRSGGNMHLVHHTLNTTHS